MRIHVTNVYGFSPRSVVQLSQHEVVDILKDLQITLNLNCKAVSLPVNRKNALLAAKKEVYKLSKGKSHEVYLSIIAKVYDRYRTMEIKTPYSGIVISWLEKELKISG